MSLNTNDSRLSDARADEQESSFNLSQLANVLLRKAWLLALFGLLGAAGGAYYMQQMPLTFLATTVMEATKPQDVFEKQTQPNDQDVTVRDEAIAAAFKSRVFLARVVATNNLTKDPDLLPGRDLQNTPVTESEAIDALSGMLEVKVRENTPYFEVSIQHSKPQVAQRLADALAEEFIREDIRKRTEGTKMAVEYLLGEANRMKEQLQRSEEALLDYVQENNAASLRDKQDTVVSKLKDLSFQLSAATAARTRLEADNDEIQRRAGESDSLLNIASVAEHPSVKEAKQRITLVETDISKLALRYTDKHWRMIQAKTELADAKAELSDALARIPTMIQASYESAVTTEEKFKQAVADQEKLAMELNKSAITYNVLSGEVETTRALFQSVVTRLKEIQIAKGIENPNVRIFEHAMLPAMPMQPDGKKVLAIAIVAGLALGAGLCLGLDALDSSLRTVEQAEGVVGLPVLGAIPRGSSRDLSDAPLALYRNPASSVAEAFRSLRTSVHLLDRSQGQKVVLLTSANPEEGKTFCAVNYAVAVAQQGLRTLLIDADLRMPKIDKMMLPGGPHRGLTDYLASDGTSEAMVYTTEIPNLFVLPAGSPVRNPAELLSSELLGEVIKTCRREFGCVVVDSAPVLPVSDSMLLVEHADATCLVARAETTPRNDVLRAARMLEQSGAGLAGLILNRLPRPRSVGRSAGTYGLSGSAVGPRGEKRSGGMPVPIGAV